MVTEHEFFGARNRFESEVCRNKIEQQGQFCDTCEERIRGSLDMCGNESMCQRILPRNERMAEREGVSLVVSCFQACQGEG